jgi:5-methylcytosine-specific restriction endonuclease McrA
VTNASRDAVRKRARDRCEYCRIRQDDLPFLRHHVEHVIPRQHGGGDDLAYLVLACYRCN